MKRLLLIDVFLTVLLISCAYQPEPTAQNPPEHAKQKQPSKSNAEKYYSEIQSRITSNWYRPLSTQPGMRCRLRITQQPGGKVTSTAIVGNCNADEVTRRSMIEAVERAGSLPYNGFEDVFEREIDFVFTYED